MRLFTRQELDEFITAKFKAFVKHPCGQCGAPAGKRFATSMPFVVKTMLDTFWCKECGRLLCESHRSQHTCERHDAKMAKLTAMSPEQLRAQMEAEAKRKIEAEDSAKAAQRAAAVQAEERRQEVKGKRQLLAAKSSHVANFLQTAARDEQAGHSKRVREELLELYTKANRINLRLWNEFEQPSVPGLADEEWQELKEVYARGVQLLHMAVWVEGQELDMRNPWDPPPTPRRD